MPKPLKGTVYAKSLQETFFVCPTILVILFKEGSHIQLIPHNS